jgi:hypothetical protein
MFAFGSIRRFALAVGLALCLAGSANAQTLHVVSIGDTNVPESFGVKVGEDARNIIATLKGAFANAKMSNRLKTHLLVGNDVNPETVLERIAKLDVRSDDAILVYYSGHGAMEPGNRHLLTFRLGEVDRSSILEAMHAKKAKLNVLLTDCCSYGVGVEARDIVPQHAPKPTLDGSLVEWSTIDCLFFRHSGLVDISAAEPGFCGKLDKQKPGSLFTNAFLRVLKLPASELVRHLDHDGDRMMQWDEILPQVRGWAAQYDREQYQGKPQQAYATSLGRWAP